MELWAARVWGEIVDDQLIVHHVRWSSQQAHKFSKTAAYRWSEFMEELRHLHLGAPRPEASAFAKMQSAYEATAEKTRSHDFVQSLL